MEVDKGREEDEEGGREEEEEEGREEEEEGETEGSTEKDGDGARGGYISGYDDENDTGGRVFEGVSDEGRDSTKVGDKFRERRDLDIGRPIGTVVGLPPLPIGLCLESFTGIPIGKPIGTPIGTPPLTSAPLRVESSFIDIPIGTSKWSLPLPLLLCIPLCIFPHGLFPFPPLLLAALVLV